VPWVVLTVQVTQVTEEADVSAAAALASVHWVLLVWVKAALALLSATLAWPNALDAESWAAQTMTSTIAFKAIQRCDMSVVLPPAPGENSPPPKHMPQAQGDGCQPQPCTPALPKVGSQLVTASESKAGPAPATPLRAAGKNDTVSTVFMLC
jgi:hypothetical protein